MLSLLSLRVKENILPGIVQGCFYVSKLSADLWYCYATVRASMKLTSLDSEREYQFHDLIWNSYIVFVVCNFVPCICVPLPLVGVFNKE